MAAPTWGQKKRRTLVLATSYPSTETRTGTSLWLVYREAFDRMGLDVEFLTVPGARAELLSTSGAVDGELHRSLEYGDSRPTLIRVPTAHFSDNFVAYANKPLRMGNNWDSLTQTALRVDYRRGATKSQRELQARVPEARLSAVNSIEVGMRKLLLDRSDVFVLVESAGDSVLSQPEFRGAGIRKVAVLGTVPGYAYLHQKNRSHVEPLAQTLASMHRDGSMEALRKQAIREEIHGEP